MMRKVSTAEINAAFGGPTPLTQVEKPKPRPIIYSFEFQTLCKVDLTPWRLEAKQREGWQLLSAAPERDDKVFLTWRRPAKVQ